jgi:hypothetical protein
MYCIVLSIRLFSRGEWIWWSILRNSQAWGYHVPPSVEIGWFPYYLTTPDRKRSAMSMFLFWVISCARIWPFSGSIDTHSQMYLGPTCNMVSSTMYSEILFLLVDDILRWRNFWIHFQIDTWLLLTLRKQNIALATFHVDQTDSTTDIWWIFEGLTKLMVWWLSHWFPLKMGLWRWVGLI